MDKLTLPPVSSLVGSVTPPGSKSIANRVLPLSALAPGITVLENLPDGDDVNLMREALAKLGRSGIRFTAPPQGLDLFLGNSGTSMRILTALLSAGKGEFRLTGIPRMQERPIGDLVDALRQLAGKDGTRIHYEGKEGFPPLRIEARGLQGGHAKIRGDISSQFLTGLLLALPLCKEDSVVEVEGKLVSAPYVELTLHVMREFGAQIENNGYRSFRVMPLPYVSCGTFQIEPDASSASYFLAAGSISGSVTVRGLHRDSIQGETRFAGVLERMGANVNAPDSSITVSTTGILGGGDFDMDLMSDTGMTLAVTALFAEGTTTIRNIGNWRIKETDRIKAMAVELRKLGATVEEGKDSLIIHPPAVLTPNVEVDTYDDHRMAMCFSLVCLGPRGVPVTIRNPDCVRKTYPKYFEDFLKLAKK